MGGRWFKLSVNRPYLIGAEALALALAVHALLFFLAGYEPERHAGAAVSGGGVTLLNTGSLPEEQRRQFDRWLAVQDPALIARADHDFSYAALVRDRGERPFGIRRSAPGTSLPTPRPLPGFSPLAVVAGEGKEPGRRFVLFAPPPPDSAPEQRRVLAFDGEFREFPVQLKLPETMAAVRMPTVIFWRRAGEYRRVRLAESCGDGALDALALQAVAAAEEMPPGKSGTVTICWPEPEKEVRP